MSKFVPDDLRCQGKKPFEARDEVLREIHKMMTESFGGVGAYLRPYRCRFCGLWHLTDTSKK